MKALVLAMAASVSGSGFAQLWRQVGELLDLAIPIALLITVVIAGGAVFFGFVH